MHTDKQQQELDQRMANLQEWLGRVDRTYQPTRADEGWKDIFKGGAKAAGKAVDTAADLEKGIAANIDKWKAQKAGADAAKVDKAAAAQTQALKDIERVAQTDPAKAERLKGMWEKLPGWAKTGAGLAAASTAYDVGKDLIKGGAGYLGLQYGPEISDLMATGSEKLGNLLGTNSSTTTVEPPEKPMDAEKLERLRQAQPETRVINNESHTKGTSMSTELYKPVELARLMELAGMTTEADDREAAMSKLSDKQKEWLGGADPTDPFVMARLKKAVPDTPAQTAAPAAAVATDATRPMGAEPEKDAGQMAAMGTAPGQQPAAATTVAQRTSPDDDYAQTQAKPQTASPAKPARPTVAAALAADPNAVKPTYPAGATTQTASPAAPSSRQDFGKGIKDTIAGGIKSLTDMPLGTAVKNVVGATPLGMAAKGIGAATDMPLGTAVKNVVGATPLGMAAKGIGAAYDALSPTKAGERLAQASSDFDAAQAAKGSQTATPAPGGYVGMEESRDSLARMRELAGMKK